MQPKRGIQRGRPAGATTFDAVPALAFGAAVRAIRTEDGIAQETLAHLAGIERSHMGKIERGEHMPTLALILKIAGRWDAARASLCWRRRRACRRNGGSGSKACAPCG